MNEQPQELEVQTPNPNTWYDATIISTKPIILALSNNTEVSCAARDITVSPGQHKYCLAESTPCWVRLKEDFNGSWRAIEVQVPGEPPNATETVTIQNWQGNFGSGVRPCGCKLFCTLDRHSLLNVINGDVCQVNIALSNRGGYMGFITSILKTPQNGNGEKI
jgi:hypothetical protein